MPEAMHGDYVEIITDKETLKGILMPKPEMLATDTIILKLDNGYNIGIGSKKVKSIKVIKKYSPEKKAKQKREHKKNLPTVAILSTGGTISSKVDYRTGGVYADYTAEDFVEMCPELSEIANLKAKKIMGLMSEDINPENWQEMAKLVAKELDVPDSVKGIVITHGTDTMHYSAAALSFFIKPNKPIILTGAQRSIDRGSSDAYMNLICAVNAAAKFDGAGVFICMHGTTNDDYCILIRGTKVRKMHTSRRDAFRPINEKPIAKVFPDGTLEIINDDYKQQNKSDRTESDIRFEGKTALVQVYPGMDPDIINYYIEHGYKGIVLSATALGHVPTLAKGYSLLPNIKKAIDKGIPVIIASQTLYGRTHPYVYTNLRKLSIEHKCIFVEDMLPEVAYVKLGWVLAHTTDINKVKEMMLTNYNGEISERSDNSAFLI